MIPNGKALLLRFNKLLLFSQLGEKLLKSRLFILRGNPRRSQSEFL
jgi:hypothetical protein